LKRSVSNEAKGALMDMDDAIVRFDMGIHNLSFILEAAEDRGLEENLVEAFCCSLYYLKDIHQELNKNMQLAFAEFREGDE